MSDKQNLELQGVRHHNLKGFSLSIPHDELVVVTGVSGSGKSSLAFDTIYAEGGRRYIETFSPYTRQFLDRLEPPDVDVVTGVRPALALEQRNRVSNSRSTVGTVTEANEFLKIIWANISTIHCPKCDVEVSAHSSHSVVDALEQQLQDSKADVGMVCFQLSFQGQASIESFKETLQAEGFVRYLDRASAEVRPIEALPTLQKGQSVTVVSDRFKISKSDTSLEDSLRDRLLQSVAQAFHFGRGILSVVFLDREKNKITHEAQYSEQLRCDSCGQTYERLRPNRFSFNSALGACASCHGFGAILQIDPVRVVPDHSKTIEERAIHCWSTDARRAEHRALIDFCKEHEIPIDVPWKKLKQSSREQLFLARRKPDGFRGVLEWFERLERKKYKMHIRVLFARYRSQFECPECKGCRLKPEALNYRVAGKTIADVWSTPVEQLLPFFDTLSDSLKGHDSLSHALEEVRNRLRCMKEVGLSYLTLDRQTRSLSGGEFQRVNLTSLLGSDLVNTLLVLDEPSIGLHPSDTQTLIEVLQRLKLRSNSLVVVEHETEVIKNADTIIDLGPQAGAQGGEVVFAGPANKISSATDSLTRKFLSISPKTHLRDGPKTLGKEVISIEGATLHNLKDIDVKLPVGLFTVITGVSGSGKSTLVHGVLVEAFQKLKQGYSQAQLKRELDTIVRSLKGWNKVDDIVVVDQSPIGASTRSNPATYTKAWDLIRECFADTETAVQLGLTKSAFSFNVDGGRCPVCKGAGSLKVEMQFLADVNVTCEECQGMRFRESVLDVRFQNRTITDFLAMTLDEVIEFFSEITATKHAEKIVQRLGPLKELGLGYLRLGQPLSELSGGEAQRVKLAAHLSAAKNENLMFVLDEPSTGLHAADITRLTASLRSLTDRGHSVVCIEHNLDIIASADWMIDLGPGGGVYGGDLLVSGNPKSLLSRKQSVQKSLTLQALEHADSAPQRQVAPIKKNQKTQSAITVSGARHHNLRNISTQVPQNKLTVITGVSGSGKSSFAFDILFSEGQRRYIDCLSPYARQFIQQLSRPDVDSVAHLPPTIAVSQKTAPPAGISTLATTTDVYQYLRLLYSKVGTQFCPDCDVEIESFSEELIVDDLLSQFSNEHLFVFAPVVEGRKGYYTELFERALAAEISEARIDGEVQSLESGMRLERHKIHWIALLIGSIRCTKKNKSLLLDAISQALTLGNGTLEIAVGKKTAEPNVFSVRRMCPQCKKGFRELDPQDFSFRSARGMCPECGGRGYSDEARERVCPLCEGARIKRLGMNVYIGEHSIAELCDLQTDELLEFLSSLQFPERLQPVVRPVLRELTSRLKMITDVGLGYLSLDRDSDTLSGGEAQRLRLARTLGSPLTGVCYILDEPTIGLHPQDHAHLMSTLHMLRDRGNTVVVVEHDEETIREADHLIDFGPGGGSHGGNIVAQGTPKEIEQNETSQTGKALRTRSHEAVPIKSKKLSGAALELVGARRHNLKGVDISIPVGALTVVAGVSGAGKSSLVHGSLVPALLADFGEASEKEGAHWDELRNADQFERFLEIDQSPIGRTPSSTPASYLGIFTDIRKTFATVPDAAARGWGPSHFSFNTKGGRCEVCEGKGYLKIPMNFLPDAKSLCEECGGKRYSEETCSVLFKELSIADVLDLTLLQAREIFSAHRKISRVLDYVILLGLGYIKLGQPTFTLSGGEAQRMKIARELGGREAKDTLYVFDEPTTGLHMNDVEKLMQVVELLLERDNTVVIIEHNLDVIRQADHLIEVGPGPGSEGGEIVYQGPPAGLLKQKKETATKRFLSPRNSQRREVVNS